jgi:hypothetical protein
VISSGDSAFGGALHMKPPGPTQPKTGAGVLKLTHPRAVVVLFIIAVITPIAPNAAMANILLFV